MTFRVQSAAVVRYALRHVIYLFRFSLWLLSELEAHLSEPGDPLILRKAYLRSNGIKPPVKLWIGRNFILHKGYGTVQINEQCALGDNVTIACHSSITIGKGFIGASGLHIDSGSHDPTTLRPFNKPILIGDNVWCGIQTTILAGSQIGDHCIIAAGGVVKSIIPDYTIAAGVPAIPKKKLVRVSENLWAW